MIQIPRRLKKEPLIEAIWQVYFESLNAGDALPGLLYGKLRQDYSSLQLHRMPVADIPAAVAQLDPNLRFAAKVRLEAQESPFLWQVGDRVVTLNCRKPYPGWHQFKTAILDLIETIKDSGMVPHPQRHSLRYIDLLTLDEAPDLSAVQLNMQLGGHPVTKRPLQMRLELPDDNCMHVVQIATPAEVRLPEGLIHGSIIDLETFASEATKSWTQVCEQLETLHDRSKQLFFSQLLTPEAIQALDPEY